MKFPFRLLIVAGVLLLATTIIISQVAPISPQLSKVAEHEPGATKHVRPRSGNHTLQNAVQLARNLEYEEAIREIGELQGTSASSAALRGYCFERLGKITDATKAFAEADRLADIEQRKTPVIAIGDVVSTIRPTELRLYCGPSLANGDKPVPAGTSCVVTNIHERFLEVQTGNNNINGYLIHEFAIGGRGRGGERVDVVAEADITAVLEEAFRPARAVIVEIHKAKNDLRPGFKIHVTIVESRSRSQAPLLTRISCDVNSVDIAQQVVALFVREGPYLYRKSDLSSLTATTPGESVLCLEYYLADFRILPIGTGEHILLSTEAQAWLEPTFCSRPKATKHLIAIAEPHSRLDRQISIHRGLELLFHDNPQLDNDNRASFLVEGWPSDQKLELQPLLDQVPEPIDEQIIDSLSTFLIPGQIAFAWSHRPRPSIGGNEDAKLYGLRNKFIFDLEPKLNLPLDAKDRDFAQTKLRDHSISARNKAMARSAVASIQRNRYPFLFFGEGHLDAIHSWASMRPADWETAGNILPPDDLKALREADNLGIADHLEAEGIGYTFLHPKANAMLLREEIGRFSQRYEKLHSAQQRGTVSDYLREIGNDRNTTTSPDIASLAAMLRAGKLPQALAKNSSLGRTSEQVARLLRNHAPPSLPANSLTAKEFLEIQAISKKYNTVIDVVGSRAEGEGRNIYTNFPVDKKEKDGEPPTRSDIDFRIDAAHPQIDDIIEDLKKIGNGAGTAGRDWSTNPATPRGRATKPPFIRFFPD